MWAKEKKSMDDEARQARLLAIFNTLSDTNKDSLLKVLEIIQKTGWEMCDVIPQKKKDTDSEKK
jgi:predicted CoA-binding protein